MVLEKLFSYATKIKWSLGHMVGREGGETRLIIPGSRQHGHEGLLLHCKCSSFSNRPNLRKFSKILPSQPEHFDGFETCGARMVAREQASRRVGGNNPKPRRVRRVAKRMSKSTFSARDASQKVWASVEEILKFGAFIKETLKNVGFKWGNWKKNLGFFWRIWPTLEQNQVNRRVNWRPSGT